MNEKPSTARIALKWGCILGLLLMVTTLAMYLTKQTTNPWFSMLTLIDMGIVLVLAMREFRLLNSGYMGYSEGLGIGALTSAIAGLLSAGFITFYNVVIDPTIQQRTLDMAREQLEDKGMADEQIDQALAISEKFQSPGFTFIAGTFGTLFIGFLLSLIVAAVIRRTKTNPFD